MAAIPATPPPPRPAPAADIHSLAERAVANVAAKRSVWTTWNIHAEAERLLRDNIPAMTPARHRHLADAITALALSPAYSICVEAPAVLDEPAELRRPDVEPVFTVHAATRYTSQAMLDANHGYPHCLRPGRAAGGLRARRVRGHESTTLDSGQRHLVTTFACDSRLLVAGIGPAGSGNHHRPGPAPRPPHRVRHSELQGLPARRPISRCRPRTGYPTGKPITDHIRLATPTHR
jgi:hypothetical protein